MRDRVTTAEAARALDVTDRRVRALIRAGRLPAAKYGRDWLIEKADLNALRRRRASKAGTGRE